MSEKLKSAIQGAGVPLTVLSEDTGISYNTLRMWSIGAVADPEPDNLEKLASSLSRRASEMQRHADYFQREAKRRRQK
jgi:hypothetical protein